MRSTPYILVNLVTILARTVLEDKVLRVLLLPIPRVSVMNRETPLDALSPEG
jgi:hypothetical protein